jgi:CheY-like chemotaxis protein
VLINICLNARDAMHTGGRLNIQTAIFELQKQSETPELKPGKYVQITFTDTGIGMDENGIMNCFDPFFSTKGLGYGLGLSSAYGIVKAHGGHIYVKSTLGVGTKVSIYIPAAAKEISAKKTEMRHETGQKVLVVDAEDLVRRVVSDILSKLGHKAVSAATEDEAISILRKKGKDIRAVILDAVLPGADYANIYSEIRKTSNSIKVIISNAQNLPAEIRLSGEREGALFIQKPYDINELSVRIRQALAFTPSKKRLKSS